MTEHEMDEDVRFGRYLRVREAVRAGGRVTREDLLVMVAEVDVWRQRCVVLRRRCAVLEEAALRDGVQP